MKIINKVKAKGLNRKDKQYGREYMKEYMRKKRQEKQFNLLKEKRGLLVV